MVLRGFALDQALIRWHAVHAQKVNEGTRNEAGPWKVGWQWLTGTGPSAQQFRDRDYFTELLRQHDHVQETRELALKNFVELGEMEGRNDYSLSGVRGVPLFMRDYSAVLTGGATGNLAAAYLGSYELRWRIQGVDPENMATVSFHAFNPSTIGSAIRPPLVGYTAWWSAHAAGPLNNMLSGASWAVTPWANRAPMSRTTQTFDWTERLRLP